MAKGTRGGKRAANSKSTYTDEQIIDAIQRFTSNQYEKIRAVQQGEKITARVRNWETKTFENKDVTNQYKDYANAIEQYVSKGDGFKGTLYRGITVDDQTLNSFKDGKVINQKGLSSWTSLESTAKNFSEKGNSNKVIFIQKDGAKKVRNVNKYSAATLMDGDEYVQSSKNKQLIQKVEKKNGITYVHVKDY